MCGRHSIGFKLEPETGDVAVNLATINKSLGCRSVGCHDDDDDHLNVDDSQQQQQLLPLFVIVDVYLDSQTIKMIDDRPDESSGSHLK